MLTIRFRLHERIATPEQLKEWDEFWIEMAKKKKEERMKQEVKREIEIGEKRK